MDTSHQNNQNVVSECKDMNEIQPFLTDLVMITGGLVSTCDCIIYKETQLVLQNIIISRTLHMIVTLTEPRPGKLLADLVVWRRKSMSV